MSRCLLSGAGLLAAALFSSAAVLAGPWPQPADHGFLISTLSFLEADNRPGNANPAFGEGRFSRGYLALYGEYGLTEDVTLGASVRAEQVQLRTESGRRTVSGVPDVELFARPVLWRGGYSTLAAQGTVVLPTGYNSRTNPALGDGAVGLEPRLLFGRGLDIGSWPAFFDLQAAYRFRLGNPADQIRLDGTLGLHPAEGWMLLLQLYNTISARNQQGAGTPGTISYGAYGTDYDLSTLVFSVVRDLSPEWSLQIGGTSEISGRNFSTGNGLFVAVWRRF